MSRNSAPSDIAREQFRLMADVRRWLDGMRIDLEAPLDHAELAEYARTSGRLMADFRKSAPKSGGNDLHLSQRDSVPQPKVGRKAYPGIYAPKWFQPQRGCVPRELATYLAGRTQPRWG